MRTFSRISVVLGATCTALLLSSCASTGGTQAGRQGAFKQQIDEAYVAHVEMLADRRGVDVRWVNPPRRLAPPKR